MKGQHSSDSVLVIADGDTVGTAIADLEAGATLSLGGRKITVSTAIPFGHKIAVQPVERGEEIYKYGEVIGRATEDISPGDRVHTHNVESTRGRGDVRAADDARAAEDERAAESGPHGERPDVRDTDHTSADGSEVNRR